VGYYIGGSVASSAHGLPRATLDVDIIADLRSSHVESLVQKLQGAYYIDPDMIRDAIGQCSSFNVIHLDTTIKIDVFVMGRQPYDKTAFQRAQKGVLAPKLDFQNFVIATAEDTILHKLYWYREGGGVSERQLSDVIGVMKVQQTELDISYLRLWAEKLQVLDLLDRALEDVGIS